MRKRAQLTMRKLIRKYYFIQLLIGFILTVSVVQIIGLLNQIDQYSQNRLILLSIVGATLYSFLNAGINALNLTFSRKSDRQVAFVWPITFWTIILIFAIGRLMYIESIQISDVCLIIVWIEPIIYNLILKRQLGRYYQI